jgi:hypothetical protein
MIGNSSKKSKPDREVHELICPNCPSLTFATVTELRGHLESSHGLTNIRQDDLSMEETDDEVFHFEMTSIKATVVSPCSIDLS